MLDSSAGRPQNQGGTREHSVLVSAAQLVANSSIPLDHDKVPKMQ